MPRLYEVLSSWSLVEGQSMWDSMRYINISLRIKPLRDWGKDGVSVTRFLTQPSIC